VVKVVAVRVAQVAVQALVVVLVVPLEPLVPLVQVPASEPVLLPLASRLVSRPPLALRQLSAAAAATAP
jgi:hypothetical protein